MIRLLATVVWPFALLDRILTDRRVRAAGVEHARETAAIEALSNGTCFRRPQLADDTDRGW